MFSENLLSQLGSVEVCLVPDQLDLSRDSGQNLAEKINNALGIEVLLGGKPLEEEYFKFCFGSDCHCANGHERKT